ncbi:hypothetical protein ACLI4U_05365 [Natrialbaceae archaeon A-CW2]|uniref:hypothetical protein n=1 Tax=Natronosalvus amylolyticus TaxID=2961994 RepID=UPI0020C9B279|nr:hypothetical protein [Natronosalvus amylolyticus]
MLRQTILFRWLGVTGGVLASVVILAGFLVVAWLLAGVADGLTFRLTGLTVFVLVFSILLLDIPALNEDYGRT